MSSCLDLGGFRGERFYCTGVGEGLGLGNEAFLVSSIFLVVEPGKIIFPT